MDTRECGCRVIRALTFNEVVSGITLGFLEGEQFFSQGLLVVRCWFPGGLLMLSWWSPGLLLSPCWWWFACGLLVVSWWSCRGSCGHGSHGCPGGHGRRGRGRHRTHTIVVALYHCLGIYAGIILTIGRARSPL